VVEDVEADAALHRARAAGDEGEMAFRDAALEVLVQPLDVDLDAPYLLLARN